MRQRKVPRHQLCNWLMIQSASLVVVSTMPLAFLDFLRNQVFAENPDYNPIFAVGMVGPMAALTGVLFACFAFRLSRHINSLTGALRHMADGDLSHQTKGLGLGLSIVHCIVELCGGRITVQSTPGEGSVFQVFLPD